MSLTYWFVGAKNMGVKEEAGAAIRALPTMALRDRCSGEGRKRAATEPGRVHQRSQGRNSEVYLGRNQWRNEGGGGGRVG